MSAAPLLETRDLRCTFRLGAGFFRAARELHAVNGVSLQVPPGSVPGLVGESGCGKSTLARMLLGLQRPSGGEIRVDSEVGQGTRMALALPVGDAAGPGRPPREVHA